MGRIKMKGYRAYFDFYDVLSEVEDLEAKLIIEVNGNPTSILGISGQKPMEGDVYNLQGLYLGKIVDMKRLPKGVYIVNGKKQIVK